MKIIVGLGNPGKEYEKTKHNVGFLFLEYLEKRLEFEISKKFEESLICETNYEGEKVVFVKPQTYMNLSGESIIKFKKFYKISNKNIIVIYDDIDLKLGDIRLKAKGSSGSHNGMKSVIENLNTEDFIRIRVGIGAPEHKDDMINYVIGQIPKREREVLDESITNAKNSILEILENGIDRAMNKFN